MKVYQRVKVELNDGKIREKSLAEALGPTEAMSGHRN